MSGQVKVQQVRGEWVLESSRLLVVSRVLERTSETGFDRNTPPRLGYTLSPLRVLERTSETGFDRNTPPRLGYTLSPPRLADKLLNIWIDRQQNPPPYVFDFLVIVNVEKGGLCLNIWKREVRGKVSETFCVGNGNIKDDLIRAPRALGSSLKNTLAAKV